MTSLPSLRSCLLIIIISFFSCHIQGQIYNLDAFTNGTTISTCSGSFFDSGGSFGTYGNNEFYVVTFCSSTAGAEIAFDFYIGDGSGADGLTFTALDVNRMTTFLGESGGGIGYGGLPGWTIEIDAYYNGGADPTPNDHLALHLMEIRANIFYGLHYLKWKIMVGIPLK